MKTNFFIIATVAALLAGAAGCSKNESAAIDNTPAAPAASIAQQPAPAKPTVVTPAVASLKNVTPSIQQGNYEAAVDTLVQAKASFQNLSDADRAQYQQQVRNATTALLSAKDSDPKAAAAYKRLSQSMTGR
jgi:hypothetical protein